jgi:hypothetical protein
MVQNANALGTAIPKRALTETMMEHRMGKKPLPTPEQLRQLLRYEPETGKLFWRQRTPEMFTENWKWTADAQCRRWNTRYAGREAFTAVDARGYKIGAIFCVSLSAHRVAWALHCGAWPEDQVDHANGVRTDNRWANLRAADIFQNNRNVRSAAGSSSKYLGVCWESRRNRWRSVIKIARKQIHLGTFKLEDDAARAYDAAAQHHYGEFARLNFPDLLGQARGERSRLDCET